MKDNNNTVDDLQEDVEDTIHVVGNELFFIGEINNSTALEFVHKFKKLESEVIKKSADFIDIKPSIVVHINSIGGCIFSGFNMMNIIERSRVKVITVAQGSCCSAATFVLLGGHKRLIARGAYVLIHQISTEFMGTFLNLEQECKTMHKFTKKIERMYLKKTNLTKKKLHALMKHDDKYLSSKKCVKYDIVEGYY